MAAPPVAGAIAPSRYSLFDEINHLSTGDSDDLFGFIEDLEKHVDASVGWRWQAAQTQIRQDSIFKSYEAFLTGLRIITDDLTEKEKELAMFPPEKDECFKRMKLYIIFVTKHGRGRSRGTKITYRSLIGHRLALLFWHRRIHNKYGISTSVTNGQLFNAITEAMRYGASKFGLTLDSPTRVDNLIFSIPHRLLIIALRRGVLEGITTLDELLNGSQRSIMIDREHLSSPIILASKPRGLELSDQAATATSLSEYLKLRGSKIGYPGSLGFYSIRRRAADDLARTIGREAARKIMNHDAGSRMLEKYYLSLNESTDISRVSLGEDTGDLGDEGYSHQIDDENTLAANALSSQKAREIHGPAVNALMTKLMATDPGFPYTATSAELKNYKRRIRRVALDSLLNDEIQNQRKNMTTMDFNDRIAHLSNSRIMEVVLEKARDQLGAINNAVDSNEEENDDPAIDSETQQIIHNLEETAEKDLEQQAIDSDESTLIHRDLDEGDDDGEGDDGTSLDVNVEIDYETAVQTFMQALLDDTLSLHRDFKNKPVLCPLCQEDDTITDPQVKGKLWTVQIKLNDHMKTIFHTPRAKWIRRAQLDFDASDEAKFRCPYYERAGIDRVFSRVWEAVRHIEADTNPQHQQYARDDGWFSPNWASHPQPKSKSYRRTKEREIRKSLSFIDLGYSDQKELPSPIPHESDPALVRASGPSPRLTIPNVEYRTGDDMFRPSPSAFDHLNDDLFTSTSQPPPYTTPVIPPHLRDYMVITNAFTGLQVEQVDNERQSGENETPTTKRQGEVIKTPATKRHRHD